jgi:ornithine cyclodeaminase
MTGAVWISEQDVAKAVDLPAAIGALREGLREEAGGTGQTMVKTHALWDERSTLHAIGGVLSLAGLVGTKTWAHTPGGACPLLLLFDAGTGALRAVVEAFALGQLRTAAVSGLATDLLAAPDAAELAIAGAGKQALAQVAAVLAVRPIGRVRVWSRTPARAEEFAGRVRSDLGVSTSVAGTPAELVRGAHVVTLATRATEPFLDAGAPGPGTHLNAIGAVTPERAEFAPSLLRRADVIAADSVAQARALSREFRDHLGGTDAAWSAVQPLSALVARGARRPEGADLTVFKAMGIGLADVALGAFLLKAGVGHAIPQPTRALISLLS